MKYRVLITVAALLSASPALAGTCEDSFIKKGNPVTGLRFIASTSVADLSPDSAVGQLRGVLLGKGYTVLAAEPESGAMLVEMPMTGKARSFPIEITATSENGVGTVRMEAKLRATMSTPEAAARSEMCGILSQLRGGKEGRTLAAKGNAATAAAAPPVRMSVLAFSSQLAGEARKNSAAVNARYEGKAFTLFGPISYVGKSGDDWRIDFKLVENALTSIIPGTGYRLEVSCMLAPGQSVYAMKLKPDKHVEVTGTFDTYDHGRSTIWLKDCRPV